MPAFITTRSSLIGLCIVRLVQLIRNILHIEHMKLNSLKFKEITSLISKRDITLDMFAEERLFEEGGKKVLSHNADEEGTRGRSRPKTSRDRGQFHNFSYINTKIKSNQHHVEDCFFYLQKSLIQYIEVITAEQRRGIRKQIEGLLGIMEQDDLEELLEKLEQTEGVLSKRFNNRLMHLAFYLVLNKVGSLSKKRNFERQIRHYVLCEYYARKFNFKQLALFICIEIHSLHCNLKNYEDSRLYARKCLRLAVVLGNDYQEAKMIENLGMLNYYEGRLNQENRGLLSKQEKRRILETYTEEKEMPDIFNFEGPKAEAQFREFTVERNNNFIQNSVPSQNVKYFQNNYHEIVKSIPKKAINVRSIISKVSQVGLVRKYFSRDNFITIRPECHIIRPHNQQQVLITHKRKGMLAQPHIQTARRVIRRLVALFRDIVNCYAFTV